MKLRAVLLLSLLVVGCVNVPSPRGSRLLPWNWFASDSTAKVDRAQAGVDTANAKLRDGAHRSAYATKQAIQAEKARQLAAGGVSRELETAEEYSDRTVSALDASEGFLTFDVQTELTRMVTLRNSQVDAERKRGDKLLAATDRIAQSAAEDKVTFQRKLAAANARVGEEQQRALVAEEKWNRLWFTIWAVVIGGLVLWLGGQIVTRLAFTNPALAPFAIAYNRVAAPALHASWQKVEDLTSRIGGFMADVRKKTPDIAERIEPILDGFLDKHHQAEAGAAAAAAGAPPKQ